MKPERWRQITEIFNAALARNEEERAAFVSAQCGEDSALRREVEAMIVAHQNAGSFGDSPVYAQTPMLEAGSVIGPYCIDHCVGAGGMGVVYRARDTRLNRSVAIKFLSEDLADATARRRFQREAQMASSLNHPHILTVHDVGEFEDRQYLVTEFVDGGTLDAWVKAETRTWRQIVELLIGVADGLAAAHGAGILHRDVKPANILVAGNGYAKLADFGLARLAEGAEGDPTRLTEWRTGAGMVIGTIAYMSPEQASGKRIDARSDIFSFGVVLYEMLAGRRPFEGPTNLDLMEAIIHREPEPLAESLPLVLRMVVEKALEKDPSDRYQSMRDLVVDLRRLLRQPKSGAQTDSPLVEGASRQSHRLRSPVLAGARRLWAVAVAVLALAAATPYLYTVWRSRSPSDLSAPVVRFTIQLPAGDGFVPGSTIALSPDGRRVAYIAVRNGTNRLFLRDTANLDAVVVDGSDGASTPFFAPDGRAVAFFASGKLKTVPVDGGRPADVCDATSNRGGTWLADGTIVFAPRPRGPLFRVPAAGGTPSEFSRLAENEASHRWPEALPDGRTVLYGAGPSATQTFWNEAHIVAQSIESGERRVIVPRGTYPRALAAGFIGYVQTNRLYALPFDARRLASTGPPVPLEGVFQSQPGSAAVAVSRTGTLAYAPSNGPAAYSLAWVDRRGSVTPIAVNVSLQAQPRLSPDGTHIAYTSGDTDTDIWVYDIARGAPTRLTVGGGNQWPIWTPDGQRITFFSRRSGRGGAFWKAADGNGPEEPLLERGGMPFSWSPDERTLAFVINTDAGGYDIQFLPMDTRQPVTRFPQTTFVEHMPAFSPSGRSIAYTSNESGRTEVYVRAYPGPSKLWPVSDKGGDEPVWSRSGRELFFRNGDDILAVDVLADGAAFSAGTPHRVVKGRFTAGLDRANYDVTPDGQRFVVVVPSSDNVPEPQLTVVLNWISTIGDRLRQR